ncbi:HPr family phosphocarrier protein [Ammoniphilus sp. CFH 90114]|uniref:HPr family phosphocarrier protein n=1 Tax=Ammoniphilus sp. CFH 90114 TaxID=2493665 RepID=UPI00100E9541|nr:HPr family phosphocarrier protein [Ammoniphilus sp. CFH 90114]RXT07916.1 HPr family phosphocarrier protein [Ammoniphilus sp. CFH 90114]
MNEERLIEKELSNRLFQELDREKLILFVQEANQFQSYILLKNENLQLNGKSVLSMIHIHSFLEGERIWLTAKGDDAEQAVARLVQVLYKCRGKKSVDEGYQN